MIKQRKTMIIIIYHSMMQCASSTTTALTLLWYKSDKKSSLHCLLLTATSGWHSVKIKLNFPAWRSSRHFSSNVPSTSSPQTHKHLQFTGTALILFIWSSSKAFKGDTTITIDERFSQLFYHIMMAAIGRSTIFRNQ